MGKASTEKSQRTAGNWTKLTLGGGAYPSIGCPPENMVTWEIELKAFAIAEHRARCPIPVEYWKIMNVWRFARVIIGQRDDNKRCRFPLSNYPSARAKAGLRKSGAYNIDKFCKAVARFAFRKMWCMPLVTYLVDFHFRTSVPHLGQCFLRQDI